MARARRGRWARPPWRQYDELLPIIEELDKEPAQETGLVVRAYKVQYADPNSLIGAIQFFKGQNFMPFDLLPRSDYGTRASGFYGCPNHLAGFLEIALLIALGLAFWGRWKLMGRMIAGYAALVCAAGLLG